MHIACLCPDHAMQYSRLDLSKSSVVSDTPPQENCKLEDRTSVQSLDCRD